MNVIEFGDCRESMRRWAAEGVKVQTCVTSPPYFGLRDYGHDGQMGLEATPDEYVENMVEVFRCVRDILADDGTLWLNLGDSYAGSWGAMGHGPSSSSAMSRHQVANHPKRAKGAGSVKAAGVKTKDLYGIPWRVAFALQADGWYLRQDIIWHKPNPMPESVRDRCTKAHEYLFLLSKSESYYFDHRAMREPAQKGASGSSFHKGKTAEHQLGRSSDAERIEDGLRNRRSVWTVATKPYKGAHFATFPAELVEPCVRAGSRPGDTVLDCFMGSGTIAQVALLAGREYRGCELNREYEPLQIERIAAANDEIDAASRQADLFQEAA